jgi:hypothetical protein
MRKGDKVVIPGFGLMDGDFQAFVSKVRPLRFYVAMGLLTRWWNKRDFVKTGEREWTHKDLVTGVEG